jgi:hypothetical protein
VGTVVGGRVTRGYCREAPHVRGMGARAGRDAVWPAFPADVLFSSPTKLRGVDCINRSPLESEAANFDLTRPLDIMNLAQFYGVFFCFLLSKIVTRVNKKVDRW